MNDQQLLEQLAAEDPFSTDRPLTTAAWNHELAFARVESLMGLREHAMPQRHISVGHRRVGWVVAVAAFAVVLVGGVVAAFLASGAEPSRPAVTTIAPVPTTANPTTVSPTTVSPTTATPTTTPNGVPESALQLINEFHAALSAGDVEAAEALFAPGGEYRPTEAEDVLSAGFYPGSKTIGEGDLSDYLKFWYTWLDTDWTPLVCNGDATEVTCTVESSGFTTLFLPGGTTRGFVTYTLGAEGIVSIVDRTVRTGGATTGFEDGLDLRGFWRTWIPENQPTLEPLWPDGNGDPIGGFSLDFAEVILEFYPQFLVEQGITVPPHYLDGSMLDALAEE